MASGAELKGLVAFQRKIRNVARKTPMAVGQALFEEMDEIERPESMKRTPVLTGDLRDSHVTVGPIIRGNSISVEIHVGSDKVNYAIQVHEDLDAFHKVGQAKFLESTLRESAPYILRRVKNRIKLEDLV